MKNMPFYYKSTERQSDGHADTNTDTYTDTNTDAYTDTYLKVLPAIYRETNVIN
jgi:hypothetical protein